MRWLITKMLEFRVCRAEKVKSKKGSIVKRAYEDMNENYKNTIMYLKATK